MLPPFFFPPVTIIFLYVSVGLLLCYIVLLHSFMYFKIPHISDNIQYLPFSIWHTLLSKYPLGQFMLLKMPEFHSFYGHAIFNCVCVYTYILEKAMAPHSSTLAWKIPWTEEPGRLQCMGSRRVGHDWATSLSLFPFMHWRRKWQPTPVFLLGESLGRGSLVGHRLWGHTESDTIEAT